MHRKVLSIAASLTLTALVFASAAWADVAADRSPRTAAENGSAVVLYALPSPHEIRVTVLRPVRIPGAVLQPGEYSFRLDRAGSMVAVTNVEGSEFFGNYLLVPTVRQHRDDTVAYTAEAPDGGPERVVSWFFPGFLRGYAFIYPNAKPGPIQVAAK